MKKEDTDKGKGKFAMRISGMTAILAILCLFSVQFMSAVQVSENVEFQTSGTNTAFIMGKDFNFDEIEVHPTYLTLGDATISVSPSAGSIDFTLFNLSTEYWKWNESCSNPGATTDHTMGGLNPDTYYLVKVDGATYGQYTSNSSGYVSFMYTGGYSDIVFEMEKQSNWWDEWMGPDSEEGSIVTTTELQAAIHHWLEDVPVRGHVMSTSDLQWIIAEWLSG